VLVEIISEKRLRDLFRNVTASYEGKWDTDAEDEGGDAVDERDEGRCGAWADFRGWKNDVVHDDVEGNAEERAVEERAATEIELACCEEEDGGG
jgi:hypothetical protein